MTKATTPTLRSQGQKKAQANRRLRAARLALELYNADPAVHARREAAAKLDRSLTQNLPHLAAPGATAPGAITETTHAHP
jgi:hypothetical protein